MGCSVSQGLRAAIVVSLVAVAAAGCTEDQEGATFDGTMKSDGYALFSVDNDRQQKNDVVVTIKDADPGSTYVLLYADSAPKSVGWFLFDPATKSRCGGDTGPHCEVAGFGFMVDTGKVAEGASEITLRDDRCGCDADHPNTAWTGHWAVMRIERTNVEKKVTLNVQAKKVKGYALKPQILQLQ